MVDKTEKKSGSAAGGLVLLVILLAAAYFGYNWLFGGSSGKPCEWSDKPCILASFEKCEPMKAESSPLGLVKYVKVLGKDGSNCKTEVYAEGVYGYHRQTCLWSDIALRLAVNGVVATNESIINVIDEGSGAECTKDNKVTI